MATLADLRTKLALDLRDTGNDTFTTAELDDLINEGIDVVGGFYPREVVTTAGTVSSGVFTYDLSAFTNIYRVDLYTSDGVFRTTIPHGIGDGPNSGWETHAGVLYIPPSWTYSEGDTVRVFGYAAYTQLSASTATTDLNTQATAVALLYAQAEAMQRLVFDRAKFQQWVADSNNTDVNGLTMAQLADQASARFERRKAALRKIRKLG